jgi:hypothetical protein
MTQDINNWAQDVAEDMASEYRIKDSREVDPSDHLHLIDEMHQQRYNDSQVFK